MTVTFTNLQIPLTVSFDRVPELLAIIQNMEQTGTGSLLQAEMQIHVTGNNADQAKVHLQELFNLGAIGDYQHKELVKQVEALKKHYLK